MDGTITVNIIILNTDITIRIINPVEPLPNSGLLKLIEIIRNSVPLIISCIASILDVLSWFLANAPLILELQNALSFIDNLTNILDVFVNEFIPFNSITTEIIIKNAFHIFTMNLLLVVLFYFLYAMTIIIIRLLHTFQQVCPYSIIYNININFKYLT